MRNSEPIYAPRTWETADIEMKGLADSLGVTAYEKLQDRAGPNGFPYKIPGNFCKVILKTRMQTDFKIMMNIRQLKKTIGTEQEYYLLPERVVELPGSVVFMYPLCERDMVDFVQNHKWTENFRNAVFTKLIDAVEFLHDKDFVHRDLKLENICMRNGYDPVIVDIDYASPSSIIHFRGTKTYMPRKINIKTLMQARKDISTSDKTKYLDTYALGKTLAFMLCVEHQRHKEIGIIKNIWSKWMKTEQTSLRSISWQPDDLIVYTNWWKVVLFMCAHNEQAVYDVKMKLYSVKDIKKELTVKV